MDVTREKRTSVTDRNAAARDTHIHDWRVAEVEFVDAVSVRVFECWCGAADMDAAA